MSINDEVIWQVIGNTGFCSYKVKIETTTLCKNRYNVTGLCTRSSCPLANSRYATILEKDGVCWLYMKTIERAHTPNKLWERVKLSKNLLQAMEQIERHLQYWPNAMINRNKQRYLKIRQMLIRMRKLRKKERRTLIPVPTKQKRVEAIREKKAERAAEVDLKVKEELLARLKKGVYGEGEDIVNLGHEWEEVLEEEAENISDEESEEEEEGEELPEYLEYTSDMEDFEYEKEEEEEEESTNGVQTGARKRSSDGKTSLPRKKPNLGKPKIELEFETEQTQAREQEKW